MIKKKKCKQFSKIPQWQKKTFKLSKATHIEKKHSGVHPLAIYPPVAILLIITAITEQYKYLEY